MRNDRLKPSEEMKGRFDSAIQDAEIETVIFMETPAWKSLAYNFLVGLVFFIAGILISKL